MNTLVVGGGIAGLSAAWELGRRGLPVTLVEAGTRFGGKIATETVGGFVIDHGPDSFLTARPAALELARELGIDGELVGVREPRGVYIRRIDGRGRDRLVPMPAGMGLVLPTRAIPFALTPLFSPLEKARMALDLVLPRSSVETDVAVGPFLRRRLGAAVVDRLAGPLVGGIYGTPIDALSIDAVVPQLRAAEREHRSLLLAGLAQGRAAPRPARVATTNGRPPLGMFATFHGGMSRLVDALVAELETLASTVDLRPATRVERIDPLGSGVVASLADGRTLRADALVLATPGPEAARLLASLVPGTVAPVRSIPHGSSCVVTLAYRRDAVGDPLHGHGLLVPKAGDVAISACTWSSEKWPGRAPVGATLLRAFLPDLPATLGESEIVAVVRRDVERLLRISSAPELVRVARFDRSMPRYTVGHLERIAAMDAALGARPAVQLVGGAYRGVGIPECVAGGRAAAARIAERFGGMVATTA